MASTAVKVDCTTCDGTGYENYWLTATIPAFYSPLGVKRYDHVAGATSMDGDAQIKIANIYRDLLDSATHLVFGGSQWSFRMMRDPGQAMGQRRLIYTLTRKV